MTVEAIGHENARFKYRDISGAQLAEIQTQMQQGDLDAFSPVFDVFGNRIYRYALARLGNIQDAEDITMSTLEKVFESLRVGGFEDRGRPAGVWVMEITINEIISFTRHNNTPPTQPLHESLPSQRNVEEQVMASIELRDAMVKINRLPPGQREVIILRFASGLSINETAQVIGKKPNNVKVLQYHGLNNLHRMYQQVQGELDESNSTESHYGRALNLLKSGGQFTSRQIASLLGLSIQNVHESLHYLKIKRHKISKKGNRYFLES